MEENTNIDSHMSNMHRINRRLVDEFECEITNEIGKSVLLQSLPPSYSAFVEGYVMAENNDNFHQCLRQLKSLKVERAAEKIVKPKGIYDIQCYKCFINTYTVLKVCDTNSSFVENRIRGVKCLWRRCPWRLGVG
jgi:hypothetical protein